MPYSLKAGRGSKARAVVLDDATADLLDIVLDKALEGVAAVVIGAKDALRTARGRPLHTTELLELEAATSAARARPASTSRPRRGAELPAGYVMPGIPTVLTHPSQRSAFARGVAAAWVNPVPLEAPYGDKGLGPVCARAWLLGLEAGKRLRKAGPNALAAVN